jgi:hypothetical protein
MKALAKILFVFSLLCSVDSRAADADDFYLHALGGWDLQREELSGGLIYGYYPWNELGLGLNYDQSSFFTATGLDIRWSIEPFEIFMSHNAAFWSEKGGKWFYLFQLGTNYLFAITPSSSVYFHLKGSFPEQKSRSLLMGIGLRQIF